MTTVGTLRVKCWNCGATHEMNLVSEISPFGEAQGFECPFCAHSTPFPTATFRQLKESEPAQSGPRELKYIEAAPFQVAATLRGLSDMKNARLLEPAFSFGSNVVELRAMLEAPTIISSQSYMLGVHFTHEAAAMGRAPTVEEAPDFTARVEKAIKEQLASMSDEQFSDLLDLGKYYLNAISGGPLVWRAQQSILLAQVTGTWTAFETLAGDLWTAAVNARPHRLALLAGSRSRISPSGKNSADGDDDSGAATKDRLDSVLREDILRVTNGTFNLRHKMGDLLSGKFTFRTLSGIREAYGLAFSEHDTSIVKALSDQSLDALSAVRNLIVHRAGKIDRKYHVRSRSLAAAPKGEIGAKLVLDGPSLNALTGPAICASINLIKAVDSWITGDIAKDGSRGSE